MSNLHDLLSKLAAIEESAKQSDIPAAHRKAKNPDDWKVSMKDLDDEEKEGKISHKDNLAKNSGRTDEAHHETEVNNTMREPDSDIEESGELMPQPDTQGGAGASDESMEECSQDGNVQLSMSDLIKLIHQLQKGGPGVDADQTLLGDEEVEEEFGNAQAGAPGPEVAPVAAVTPTGDDMHSKGLEVHKMNGGGNPLHAHLAELYAEIKERPVSEERTVRQHQVAPKIETKTNEPTSISLKEANQIRRKLLSK
jgi:hypothetical protein